MRALSNGATQLSLTGSGDAPAGATYGGSVKSMAGAAALGTGVAGAGVGGGVAGSAVVGTGVGAAVGAGVAAAVAGTVVGAAARAAARQCAPLVGHSSLLAPSSLPAGGWQSSGHAIVSAFCHVKSCSARQVCSKRVTSAHQWGRCSTPWAAAAGAGAAAAAGPSHL